MRASPIPILIADNDTDSRLIYGQYLRYAGFEVLEAEDAATALSLARTHIPRAIICDLLPATDEGVRFLDALGTDPVTRSIPVLLVTAWLLTPNWSGPGLVGRSRVLLKPCPPAELLHALTGLLVEEAA
jgi:CheY-like chemotaxis protein